MGSGGQSRKLGEFGSFTRRHRMHQEDHPKVLEGSGGPPRGLREVGRAGQRSGKDREDHLEVR